MTEEGKHLPAPTATCPLSVKWLVAYPDRARGDVISRRAMNRGPGLRRKIGLGRNAVADRRMPRTMMGEFERGISLFGGGWGIYQQVLAGNDRGPVDRRRGNRREESTPAWRCEAPFGSVKLYFDPATHLSGRRALPIRGPAGRLRRRAALERLPHRRRPPVRILDGRLSRRREIHGIHDPAGGAESEASTTALFSKPATCACEVTTLRAISPSKSLCRCSSGHECTGAPRRPAASGNVLAITGLIFPAAVHTEEFVQFAAQQRPARLPSAEIHADHGRILAHQFERMKPRRLRAAPSPRAASFAFPPGPPPPKIRRSPDARSGRGIVAAARTISRRSGPSPSRFRPAQLPHHLHEIAFLVIDRMVHADFAQEIPVSRPRRAENHQTARARQLHGRDSHAARRPVNQDAVSRAANFPS